MGRCVVKTARDRDQYLIWSSVVDAPVAGPGTREQVKDWLLTEDRTRWTPDEVEEILARTDLNGSSDRAMRFAWWDEYDYLQVGEGSPGGGWYHLRRDRLADYADALERDDEAGAQALLECWRRHGEDNG